MARASRTKPGKHGPLYRFVVTYDDGDECIGPRVTTLWAYDAEHAAMRFHDDPFSDGFDVVAVRKV